jgi:SAM-dependent methyltransferase
VNRETAREWTLELSRRYLPDEPDAYNTFLHLAAASCPEGGRVVDLGCGEEGYLTYLIDKAGEIIGVDSKVTDGPYHHYIQSDLDLELPLESESVDLAASKFLLEHLGNPDRFFRQTFRILRPGGALLLMTPNVFYYPYLINLALSRCMPQERRMRLVERVTGRPPEDVFPVLYRCNTPSKIRRGLLQAGFELAHLGTYSDFLVSAVNRPLGAIALAYEKGVNIVGLKGLKGFILAEARKRPQ